MIGEVTEKVLASIADSADSLPMITSGAMVFFIVGGAILEKSEKSFGLTINRRKCQ